MSTVNDTSEPSSACASASVTAPSSAPAAASTETQAPATSTVVTDTDTDDTIDSTTATGTNTNTTTTTNTNTNTNTNTKDDANQATQSKSPPASDSGVNVPTNHNHNSQSNNNQNNNQNPYTTAPLSPMHPPHMHTYYYQQQGQGQVPNSPATPSVGTLNINGGYDMNAMNVQSLLGPGSGNNVFMRQQHQYPIIPPLSPGVNVNTSGILENNSGEYVGMDQQDINLSMGTVGVGIGLPPASPLFPGAPVAMFGTEPDNNNGHGVGHGHGVGAVNVHSVHGQVHGQHGQVQHGYMNNGRSMVTPNSPSLQYLTGPPPSPVISYGGMYPSGIPNSPEVQLSWSDRSLQQHQMYPPTTPTPSPHLQSMQYQQTQNRRTTSFDGEFLPPSALGEDSTSAVYATGGTLFSAQQPWGYNAGTGPLPPNSPYTQHTQVQQNQQLQQQQQQQQQQQNSVQSHHQQNQIRSPPRGRQGRGGGNPGANPGAAGGQPPNFYPAATPGPPIQTTAHNKGPEGANLFIFHIPNHFTNLDMWHLFCHYGNLLSVRIMVEKDTGRSRGFGFVSYDSPDAAALAIKELNGFVIGNKRLKVQHKQIRQGEMNAPSHDHVAPPPMYSESNEHGQHTAYVNQHQHQHQHMPPQGDIAIAGGHQVQGAGFSLTPQEGETHPVEHEHQLQHQPVENTILNLDSIREALPEVSK